MIASILPGVRHIRTPLVAGYLYLLCIWVIFHKQLVLLVSASGELRSARQLFDFLGQPATLAAISFVAYVLGSLLVVEGWKAFPLRDMSAYRPVGIDLPDFYDEMNTDVRNKWRRRYFEWKNGSHKFVKGLRFGRGIVRDLCRPRSESRQDFADLTLRFLISRRSSIEFELEHWLSDRMALKFNAGLTAAELIKRTEMSTDFIYGLGDALSHRHMYPEIREQYDAMSEEEVERTDLMDGWNLLVRSMVLYLRTDFRSLVTRLQIQRPELHNDYDRLEAEAELRLTIAIPLSILAIAGAVVWSPLTLLILLLVALLVIQGLRRKYDAEMNVWQALIMEVIESPTMERFEAIDTTGMPLPKWKYSVGR